MRSYEVVCIKTGFFSGSLNPNKLQQALNDHGAAGWKLVRSIHETRRVFLIFPREAHFLIFEREA